MAAADKLIPQAKIIGLSLNGQVENGLSKYHMPSSKGVTRYKNPWTDAVAFLSGIYSKELHIATGNATWDQQTVDGNFLKSTYVPNRNTYNLLLGTIVAASENEWNELQIAISKCFNIIKPFHNTSYIPVGYEAYYYNLMGVLAPVPGATRGLYNANGVLLGNYAQGETYAAKWNSVKVPADAALNVVTPFLAPIASEDGTTFYYRYTGIRQWLDFTGYDS